MGIREKCFTEKKRLILKTHKAKDFALQLNE